MAKLSWLISKKFWSSSSSPSPDPKLMLTGGDVFNNYLEIDLSQTQSELRRRPSFSLNKENWVKGENGTFEEDCSHARTLKICKFAEAPLHNRFNPYITDGYRGPLTPLECLKSIFWWTNETLNIWSHLFGFVFFVGISVYDALGLFDMPNMQLSDRVIFTLLLFSFQACMILSTLYHTFCCCNEETYQRWLSADLFGISLTFLSIYISGIYYAFSCILFWRNFYLFTITLFFLAAIYLHLRANDDGFSWQTGVFVGWGSYGVVPTLHWAWLHDGMADEAVVVLLPRIIGVYILAGLALTVYMARIPERFWPGLVNYVGSSHQIWHVLVFTSFYYWFNTGMIFVEFRATHPCNQEMEIPSFAPTFDRIHEIDL